MRCRRRRRRRRRRHGPDIDGYGDIREYADKLFENHGRGIGEKGKDNGLLILLALKERRVWVEVGYDLEQWITDGFAGETSRLVMAPHFRAGDYGAGLRAGAARIVARIAQGRNVTLDGVRGASASRRRRRGTPIPFSVMIMVVLRDPDAQPPRARTARAASGAGAAAAGADGRAASARSAAAGAAGSAAAAVAAASAAASAGSAAAAAAAAAAARVGNRTIL